MAYTINDWLGEHCWIEALVRDPAVADEQSPDAFVHVRLPLSAYPLRLYFEQFRTTPETALGDFLARLEEYNQRRAGGDA